MRIYREVNNPGLDLALVKALARANISVEHVAEPGQAELLVLFEQGKFAGTGFGVKIEDATDLLSLDIPKVIVSLDGRNHDDKTVLVRPVLKNGRRTVNLSEVVNAVKLLAGPEFEIEDDTADSPAPVRLGTGTFADHAVPGPAEPPVWPHGEPLDPAVVTTAGRTLRDRLEPILAQTGSVAADAPRPGKVVMVKPLKNGVGVTTLCACLVEAMAGLGAVHGDPGGTGWVYYGATPAEAASGGLYVPGCPPAGPLVILDNPAFAGPADALAAVIDDSMSSYHALKTALDSGLVPDLVVVSRKREGLPESVFRTGFPQLKFFTVLDNYKACIDGQEAGKPPTAFSPDMGRDIGKLAAKVREILDL